jgi:hypothetical protein
MFMHIVMQLSGRLMALYTQVLVWLKERLLKLVSSLRVSITQVYQSAVSLLPHLAKTLSKIKALLASLTTQVLSIKAGLKLVVTTSGQIGQLLQTTVRQIRQHVAQAFKKGQ